MDSISIVVQITCLSVLSALVGYALWLIRSGRLSAHLAVRWVLSVCVAILVVMLWGRLPFIAFKSGLEIRELLVILAVLFFVFISYLILDCLVRVSEQTNQIMRLAQELSMLRQESLESAAGQRIYQVTVDNLNPTIRTELKPITYPRQHINFQIVALVFWIFFCILLYLLDIRQLYPDFLKDLLSASYLQ